MFKNENTAKFYEEIASRLKNGVSFDHSHEHEYMQANFICHDQKDVARVRSSFPGIVWTKKYIQGLAWWEYYATFGEWTLRIFGCDQKPATCKMITEKKEVAKDVPIEFETVTEVQDVLVGWDCGGTVTMLDEPAE